MSALVPACVAARPGAETSLALAGRLGAGGQRRAGALVPAANPKRWLPINNTSALLPEGPRRGWKTVDELKEKAGTVPAATGCSELVRTARRALQARPGAAPAPQAFWRLLAKRGGQLAKYLGPDEVHELLVTLADARLRWERDPVSREGLRGFAAHVADEIGAFGPPQLVGVAGALARLRFVHEDFLQSLSRAVEGTARNDRVRLDNKSICDLLAVYRKLALLDEPVMRSLSVVLCRRFVREPPTPQQTAQVVVAFAELRMRDLRLFNATTLAFTRKGVLEELGWTPLADVALAYASLRLHSDSLFSRIQHRLCDSSGAVFLSGASVQAKEKDSELALARGMVREMNLAQIRTELTEDPPEVPRVELPAPAVAKFLQVHVHFGRFSRLDLVPLLPHLAHPASKQGFSTDAALALLMLLTRGQHVWPWLWCWVSPAFHHERLVPSTLVSMLEAVLEHLGTLKPLVAEGETWLKHRKMIRGLNDASPMAMFQHLHMLARHVAQLYGHIGRRATSFSDVELRQVVANLQHITAEQDPALKALSRARRARPEDFGVSSPRLAVQHALASAVRSLGAELLRRRIDSPGGVNGLLHLGNVRREDVENDLMASSMDSVSCEWLPTDAAQSDRAASDGSELRSP